MTRKNHRINILALCAFCLYTIILLHPLWAYNGTHVAGYDYFNYNWNFWWIRHAWANGLNVYLNDYVLFPAMSNYGYHALTAFWYPLWAILEPFVGTLTSVNLIITIACVLNGFIVFLWLRSIHVHTGLALLGGVVLQTLPIARYWYYNTHLNLMDWFWIPGLLRLWKGIADTVLQTNTWNRQVLGKLVARSTLYGVALWGLLMTDLQFPIFAAFVVAPFGMLTLWQAAHAGRKLVMIVASGVIAVSVGVVLMWFAGPLPYIATFAGGLVPGPVEDRPGIPFPSGWLTMAQRWWLWDQPSVSWFFTLAVLISLTSALSVRKIRRGIATEEYPVWLHWFWLLVAIPPLILALGPQITIGGMTFPMPFVGLYALTDGNFRMPWRLAPAGVIAAVTFMGLLWTPFLRRLAMTKPALSRIFVPLGGAAILLLSHCAVRLFETAPLEPVLPAYQGYEEMREDDETYVVLQAPTGMGTGEVLLGNPRAIQYQWYGITHEKRMINGFISRTPIEDFFYVDTGDALLSWLGQRRLLEPELVTSQLRERIFEYPIGYIVLHTDDIDRHSITASDEIAGFFNGLDDLLCPARIEGAAIIYRTRWNPAGCEARTPAPTDDGVYEIDIGAANDRRYLGWGWYYAEPVGGVDWRWIGGQPQLAPETTDRFYLATVYLTVPPGEYQLVITGQSFERACMLSLTINGASIAGALEFVPGNLQEQVSPPFRVTADGRMTIEFGVDGSLSPRDLGMGDDDRQLSIAVERIRVVRVGGM